MKFTVLQENFAKSLNQTARAVSNRPGLHILSNILIEVIDNKIKFSATDLELGIINWLPAEVAESGKVTVSARTLSDFINSIGSGKLEIYTEGNVLKVKSENSKATFNTIPAEEFPEIPNDTEKEVMSINSALFSHVIEKVTFASATDDTRPVLTGTLFEIDKSKLSIVGVDGFRLSKQVLSDVSVSSKYSAIVPARTLNEIAKIAKDDEEGEIKMFVVSGNNQVLFRYKDTEFVSRLIEGEFPDYRQILPTEHVLSFEVNKARLAEAIKIVSIFARDIVGNKTIISIDTLNSKATLSANLAEVGGNEVDVELEKVKGTDIQIAFSAKYLSDMISHLDGDTLSFEINGATSPGVFREVDNDDFLHIVMPMRID